jgi:hypothetical protein
MKLPSLSKRTLAALATMIVATALLPSRADTLFTVRQTYMAPEVAADAKLVRGWFWMPEDRPEQKVIDFRVVEAPKSWRVTRDPKYGRKWIYAEAPADLARPLKVVAEFKVLRRSVSGMAEADKAGLINESHRMAFAEELRKDEKNMEVTMEIERIANEIAGKERNPVLQAQKFFQFVIYKSEHYSKSGSSPNGLCIGSAAECLKGTGDCCTDQHALFIALCRARDIPCRLFYGSRLKPETEGKDHDPGYRCWPNFFAPGIGWVPLDISSADTAKERPMDWFGGLDENRLEWAEGRDFDFEPRSATHPDLVIRGWVEVDGKSVTNFTRTVNFTRQILPDAKSMTASK